jgi:hypothetical protein
MAAITGWGRGTWGEGAWDEPLPVDVSGLSVSGEVGTVIVTTGQRVLVAGVEAGAEVGGLREIVFVTGVQAGVETSRVLVWGREIPDPGTVWTEIAA